MKRLKAVLNNLFFWTAIAIFVTAVALVALGRSTDDIYVFGYKPFVIATGSMETEYLTNSLAVIKKGGFENIEVGDVVAFTASATGQMLALHRVVSQTDDAFVTKGDNNAHVDDILVTKDNFIGKEVFHTNLTAYWVNELHKPFGWLRMIALPILAIIMFGAGIHLLNRWTTDKNLRRLIICGTLLTVSITTLIFYNIWDNQRIDYTNQKLADVVGVFTSQNGGDSQTSTTVNNREIVGAIEIGKLNVKYPIIAYDNDSSLNISIAKYSGPELNENGNVVLLGHRSANGGNLFFTRIDQLTYDDIVTVTDKTGRTISYKVVEFSVHTPDDLLVLDTNEPDTRELTLISCSLDLLDRYVVKLVEEKTSSS